jgi:hypothetical protein
MPPRGGQHDERANNETPSPTMTTRHSRESTTTRRRGKTNWALNADGPRRAPEYVTERLRSRAMTPSASEEDERMNDQRSSHQSRRASAKTHRRAAGTRTRPGWRAPSRPSPATPCVAVSVAAHASVIRSLIAMTPRRSRNAAGSERRPPAVVRPSLVLPLLGPTTSSVTAASRDRQDIVDVPRGRSAGVEAQRQLLLTTMLPSGSGGEDRSRPTVGGALSTSNAACATSRAGL